MKEKKHTSRCSDIADIIKKNPELLENQQIKEHMARCAVRILQEETKKKFNDIEEEVFQLRVMVSAFINVIDRLDH